MFTFDIVPYLKTLNQAILTALYYQAPQSIAELSHAIGKSVPNITRSVQELLKDNLITSDGLAPSTGGRRAIHYSLNIPVLPNLLAIAIDQYNTSISLLDLSNHIIKELEQAPIHLDQSENPVQEILLLIDGFLEGQDKENILTVGISMPGFVD